MLTRLVPLLFVVLWSTGFIFTKLAVAGADGFTFLLIRFASVAFILAALAVALGVAWPNRRQAAQAALAGALIHGTYLGPLYWAMAEGMPAGITALIVSMQPILTALLVPFTLGERISPRHWLGLGLGALGVLLVLEPRLSAGTSDMRLVVVLAAGLSLLGVTFGSMVQKRFATGLDLRTGGVFQFLGAAALMLACAAAFDSWRIAWTLGVITALLWSIVVLSLGAITLLMLMIREGALSKVAVYFYLVPPTTALMAWAAFGETLSPLQLTGMALACLAVVLVSVGGGDVPLAETVRS